LSAANRLVGLTLPFNASDTCCVEIRPRLKIAVRLAEHTPERVTSLVVRIGSDAIGFNASGDPSSATTL
jgi:hypothetical protein